MNPGYETCHGRLLAALHLLFLIRRIPRTRRFRVDARERERSVRPNRGKSERSTGDISMVTLQLHTYFVHTYILRTYSSLYKVRQTTLTPDYINARLHQRQPCEMEITWIADTPQSRVRTRAPRACASCQRRKVRA